MDEFQEIEMPQDFKVQIVETGRILTPSVQNLVDTIWNRELLQREGKLFNGTVLGIVEVGPSEILVEKVEYKLVLAKMRDPSLAKELDFKLLATSGMTLSHGKVLLGQRSSYVSLYPNDYEMVPSGSIDANSLDIKAQLKQELEEEAGIGSSYIEKMEGWQIIFDVRARTYEVVARIIVSPLFSESPIHRGGSGEYRSLMWLGRDELEKHLIQHSEKYVPLTKYLFSRWDEFML